MEHGVTSVSERLRAAAESYAGSLVRRLGDNLVSVVLYGSVARGEAREGSDIDLLVVCDELPDGRFARLQRLEGAERDLEAELTMLRADGIDTRLVVIVRTRSEAEHTVPLYLDMVEDARRLHDRDGFFAAILARLSARLIALGAQRRRLGRTRYWVLKRDFVPGEIVEL
jgi:predicted nucleotidyltransferase